MYEIIGQIIGILILIPIGVFLYEIATAPVVIQKEETIRVKNV